MSIIDPKLEKVSKSPQQTVGPYVTLGLMTGQDMTGKDNDLTHVGGKGKEIVIRGHLFAGDGQPLFNVMVEFWQANSQGVFNHPSEAHKEGYDEDFLGFGRFITDETGYYEFRTYKPGPISDIDDEDLGQVPNIIVIIHASGLDYPLYTRLYFEDEDNDDIFLREMAKDQADTLIAKKVDDESQAIYQFDIVIEGKADDLTLESKLDGEEVEDMPDGRGKPLTYLHPLA